MSDEYPEETVDQFFDRLKVTKKEQGLTHGDLKWEVKKACGRLNMVQAFMRNGFVHGTHDWVFAEACRNGNAKGVELMVQCGADVLRLGYENSMQPAIVHGQFHVVRFLDQYLRSEGIVESIGGRDFWDDWTWSLALMSHNTFLYMTRDMVELPWIGFETEGEILIGVLLILVNLMKGYGQCLGEDGSKHPEWGSDPYYDLHVGMIVLFYAD